MILMKLKKFLNRFGYDIKRHHPIFENTILPLGIKTVIDIGANTGVFAQEMRKKFPEAQLYMFEPLSDCFAQVMKAFAHDQKAKAFPIALGDTKGSTVIERSSFHPSSSLRHMTDLHKELYPKSKGSSQETIQINTLDEVLWKIELSEHLLVKIDVQGYEDKVLMGGKNVMQRASAAILETSYLPLYEGQPLFNDICRLMDELGFLYYGDLHRHYHPVNGTLLYEDSLFLKKELVSAS